MMTEEEQKQWLINYSKQREEEQKQVIIDYERIMKEDADKDFMDILPSEFKKIKRSIIKPEFLTLFKETFEILKNSPFYSGVEITEKKLFRYISTNSYDLQRLFFPKLTESKFFMNKFHEYVDEKKLTKDADGKYGGMEFELIMNIVEHKLTSKIEELRNIERNLQGLEQSWDMIESRIKIKKGLLVHEYDIGKDGFPSTSRGNLCYLFTPVKGGLPTKKIEGDLKLYNPRTKKDEIYKIIDYKEEDNIFACLTPKNKKVFLIDYDVVNEAWDCLFSVNKEIYSGWWNKVMELK